MTQHQLTGEVARELDVSVNTVRSYEKAGLADSPLRDPRGRRRYCDDDVGRPERLVRMRSTGMSIGLLHSCADARRLGPARAGQRRAILVRHRADVAVRIVELAGYLDVIDHTIDSYARREADPAWAHHQEEVPA